MLDLQLDGIGEAPLGIVVCCDRRAAAAGVLGRATFPDTDMWSCACAIENLWLAARAEGLGLGWVTLFPPEELAALVGLPPGVETLGWLCLGWPDERPARAQVSNGPAGRGELRSTASCCTSGGTARRPPPPAIGPASPRPGGRRRRPRPGRPAPDAARLARRPGQGARPPGRPGDRRRSTEASLVLVAADHPVTRYGVSTYPSSGHPGGAGSNRRRRVARGRAARAAGLGIVAVDAGVDGEPVAGAVDLRPGGHRGDLASEDACRPRTSTGAPGQGPPAGPATCKPG